MTSLCKKQGAENIDPEYSSDYQDEVFFDKDIDNSTHVDVESVVTLKYDKLLEENFMEQLNDKNNSDSDNLKINNMKLRSGFSLNLQIICTLILSHWLTLVRHPMLVKR